MNTFSTPFASTVGATAVFAPVSIAVFTPSMWNVSVPVSPRLPVAAPGTATAALPSRPGSAVDPREALRDHRLYPEQHHALRRPIPRAPNPASTLPPSPGAMSKAAPVT